MGYFLGQTNQKGPDVKQVVAPVTETENTNLFNEERDFKPSWDGLQDTITDTGIDILAGTTSSAAGAAIGSLFLPPVGTAVGALWMELK